MRHATTLLRVALASAVLLMATASGLSAPARADDGGETVKPRYWLSPSFTVGEKFRVERRYRQTTYTSISDSRRNPVAQGNPLEYDASMQLDAVVTIERVDAKGGALVWSVFLEKLRVDVPDPLQTPEYRLRVRERKQKRLPYNSHPLEGETVKVDLSGAKMRLFKVLDSGEDAGIVQRYPEVLPLMQELVDPDWTPVDTVSVGGEWEMNADHIFRLTKVLLKAPLKGTINCRLASVADGIANVDFTAALKETYATIEMRLEVTGRIEFDIEHRRQVGTSFKGEVQIGAKGSSLSGRGVIEGGNQFTAASGSVTGSAPK